MSRCIVSYAVPGRENYPVALPRLVRTALAHGYQGEFIISAPYWFDEIVPGVKNERDVAVSDHEDVPYGFKPELIQEARRRGHTKIVWCDSTVVFTANTDRLFDFMDQNGILLFDNPGCPIPYWTSDTALETLGWPDDKLDWQTMACVLGFDFENSDAVRVFNRWVDAMHDGLFYSHSGSIRPDFKSHRHDQSIISILGRQCGFPFIKYGTLCYWNDRGDAHDNLVCNRGVHQK